MKDGAMSNTIVLKHGNKIQISNQRPRRLYVSRIYPFKSSNGSTVAVSGTDNGLLITWTAGKPLYFTSQTELPLVNGTNNHERVDDLRVSEEPESDDEAMFESDEEELDDEQPYPSIVQDLELPLGSAVLHLATPKLPPPSSSRQTDGCPDIISQSIVLAAATSDGVVKVITLPLDPPSAATKRKRRLGVKVCTLTSETTSGLPRGIALTWTDPLPNESQETETARRQTRSRSRSHAAEESSHSDSSLLIAASSSEHSGTLNFYRVPIYTDEAKSVIATADVAPFFSRPLAANTTRIAFNNSTFPSSRHTLLLIADTSGHVRVYDPLNTSRPSSRESRDTQTVEQGLTHFTLSASFQSPQDLAPEHPGLAGRKKVIDACWVCGGRSVMALLEDGEWVVWDLEGAGPRATGNALNPPLEFAVRGFVGDAPEQNSITSKGTSKAQLAPMTPNTRRVRQENLFNGPTSQTGVAVRGGISAESMTNKNGATDDSVVLWYNSSIFTIPSLMNLWQHSAMSKGRDTGSLYGPGLSRVEHLELFGETINSVTNLPARQAFAPVSGLGNFNVQRDLLVTTEYRLITLANTRTQPTKSIFSRAPESPNMKHDKQLLDRGDLDLGGMDRMLDSMSGIERTGPLARAKKVGFAAH